MTSNSRQIAACINAKYGTVLSSANAETHSPQYSISGGAKHAKFVDARNSCAHLKRRALDIPPLRLYAARLTHVVTRSVFRDVKLTCLSAGRATKVENAQLNGKADNVIQIMKMMQRKT